MSSSNGLTVRRALGLLGALCLGGSACAPPDPDAATPGGERVGPRPIAIHCPGDGPRYQEDCGLISYYWLSDAHVREFRATRCQRLSYDSCLHELDVEFRILIRRRYPAGYSYAIGRALPALETVALSPLVFEVAHLVAHNHALQPAFATDGWCVKPASGKSGAAACRTLADELLQAVTSTPAGLPTADCPQRVLAGGVCEGPLEVVGAPWRYEPFTIEFDEPRGEEGGRGATGKNGDSED